MSWQWWREFWCIHDWAAIPWTPEQRELVNRYDLKLTTFHTDDVCAKCFKVRPDLTRVLIRAAKHARAIEIYHGRRVEASPGQLSLPSNTGALSSTDE